MSLEYNPETVTANCTHVEMVVTANANEGSFGVMMVCKNYDGTKVEAVIDVSGWSMGQFTVKNSDRLEWFEEDGVLTVKNKGRAKPEAEDEADTDED